MAVITCAPGQDSSVQQWTLIWEQEAPLEIKMEIKHWDIKMDILHTKLMACFKSSTKKKVYSNTGPHQYIKKNLKMNNLTLSWKELEIEAQIKPKVSRRKGIIKIKVEINEVETKNIIEKIKLRVGSLKK